MRTSYGFGVSYSVLTLSDFPCVRAVLIVTYRSKVPTALLRVISVTQREENSGYRFCHGLRGREILGWTGRINNS